MDRKMIRQQKGFSLIELMVVMAIVAILAVSIIGRKNHTEAVNSVNDDLHSISMFMKRLRLDAFTQKQTIYVTVAGTQVTTVIDPSGDDTAGVDPSGDDTVGRSLNLQNNVVVTGSPFTVTTRGNYIGGNIRLVDNSLGTKYSCVVIDNIRIRLGEINAGACDAI